MKYLFSLFLIFLFSCGGQQLTDKHFVGPNQSISNAYYSTVSISSNGKHLQGAGVVIYHKKHRSIYVLTACHVIDKNKKTFIMFNAKKKYEAISVKEDWPNDICLLQTVRLANEDGPYVRVSKALPKVGDRVVAIGTPNGRHRAASDGIVSGYYYDSLKIKGVIYHRWFMKFTNPIFYGSSGGGIYNSKGELVGITRFLILRNIFMIVPGSGYTTHLLDIRKFLDGYNF